MSYQAYHTEGFVISTGNSGEGDRLIALFTKQFGLIHGLAKSVREERSKLRYGLQVFSCGTFSLVRGKGVWRITGATNVDNVHLSLQESAQKQLLVAHITMLLRRLLHGEEQNEYLFDTIHDGVRFLKQEELTAGELQNFECLCVLRILHSLGYLSDRKEYEFVLARPVYNSEMIASISPLRRSALREINRSLRETQL